MLNSLVSVLLISLVFLYDKFNSSFNKGLTLIIWNVLHIVIIFVRYEQIKKVHLFIHSKKNKMKTVAQNPIIGQTITEEKKVFVISEGTTGNKLKKQSPVNLSKFQANKDYKSSEGSLSKMLKHVAEYGKDYLTELNKRNGTNITPEFLLNSINEGTSSIFAKFGTIKELASAQRKGEKLGKNSPVFTFWLVLSFVSRYSEANKVKKQKETK